jgi:hypothetical protein
VSEGIDPPHEAREGRTLEEGQRQQSGPGEHSGRACKPASAAVPSSTRTIAQPSGCAKEALSKRYRTTRRNRAGKPTGITPHTGGLSQTLTVAGIAREFTVFFKVGQSYASILSPAIPCIRVWEVFVQGGMETVKGCHAEGSPLAGVPFVGSPLAEAMVCMGCRFLACECEC